LRIDIERKQHTRRVNNLSILVCDYILVTDISPDNSTHRSLLKFTELRRTSRQSKWLTAYLPGSSSNGSRYGFTKKSVRKVWI